MATRISFSIQIEQDEEDDIFLRQENGDGFDVIIMSPETALKLAYKLMSFARGQDPAKT